MFDGIRWKGNTRDGIDKIVVSKRKQEKKCMLDDIFMHLSYQPTC